MGSQARRLGVERADGDAVCMAGSAVAKILFSGRLARSVASGREACRSYGPMVCV